MAGNPTSVTSPEGHVTKQTFDALNRATSLIEPVSGSESITTTFGYDATGTRTRLTDGRGNATWTSYNSLGLAETVTEPATTAHPNAADRTWTHIYDAAGNQKATIQPGEVRIDRTFDHLGRLTKETGAGGGAAASERAFGYDLASRLTTAGDLTVDYNDRSLPLKISRGTAQETAYGYDDGGNLAQRIDAAGTATFTWDGANRLETTTDPLTNRTLTYGYDPASRLKTITATSGQASTQTIDYDNMDRITGQTLQNGSGTQLAKITYGWDKDNNLTTKTTAGTAGAGTNTYGYDHAGRLTSWTAPGGAVTAYEWDASGNRTKAGNKTFAYDERNRLTSGDGTDYTYTPRGTLATQTKAGTTTNYTFNAFDQLIADGDSLYSYDAIGRMTTRIRGTAKQSFAYSGLGNDLAAITDSSGAVQAKYSRDINGGLLSLQEGAGAAAATLSDLHGDLVATFTANLQTSTAYDPFGTAIAQTGTKTNLGYQGEYTDPDTGKVNMHARWYQPDTSTFSSRDTATLNPNPSVQANRYTYANASPLIGTDPTGHATVINGGSIAGNASYTPGVGSKSVSEIYAQYGIMFGGGSGFREDIGGGAIACDIWSCDSAEVIDPTWIQQIEWNPGFSQDELARLGWKVMPNGRLVDQPNFWFASEKVQNEYMTKWSPLLTNDDLAFNWVAAGGLASIEAMENAARRNPNDPRLAGFKLMSQENYSGTLKRSKGIKPGSRNYAAYTTRDSSTDQRYGYYTKYKRLIKLKTIINEAAKEHGIDRNALAAVLIYEMSHWEPTGGYPGDAVGEKEGWQDWTSLGIGQMQIGTAREMMKEYYGDMGKNLSNRAIGGILNHDTRMAVRLAAAYMRYLKKTIKVPGGPHRNGKENTTRHINDWEAAVAYGVKPTDFAKWRSGGPAPTAEAQKRWNAIYGWVRSAANEYWDCVSSTSCKEPASDYNSWQ
ncbi:RHS repeat-associated core domain-containing protein [Nonomuraea solani]|uniref:RHS repeat-associated core domain-containing protein n=1 Tax=Nonomuraea solani TaxID=1144553 RepID=UPI0011B029DB|nr:RHS repeat-associated core domain-containing protein [Nonomuraea solani]